MKALSLRQPWAWAVVHAGKRVENRTAWTSSKFRGPLLIHAAAGLTRKEYIGACDFMVQAGVEKGDIPYMSDLERGGIVGRCRVVDTIESPCQDVLDELLDAQQQRWWMGGFALILADVEPLPFIPIKGRLGLFEVPDDVVARLQ